MKTANRVCVECGATVFADAPQGICSVCLFRTGLASEDAGAFEPTAARMLKDFGDYELLEEIGRGGQGVVYRARQKSLNRIVALKVIGLAHWATEAHVKRFRLEAEAAAHLDDPHIVPIYEIGERDGACYFSMKFIEGGQLDKIIGSEPMPVRKAAELTAKLTRTVQYAHEHGILHRDIKPGNILLDRKGEPHLTDFGLARLVETESNVTHTSEVLGTPSYMAPEQAVGDNTHVNNTTDVYGLGAVFYQLLTGQPPFVGQTTYETVRLVLESEPRQPRQWNRKVGRDLATICLKCLEKDPPRRYPSALALAEDLERWLRHEPIRARRAGIFDYGKKWLRRNPTTAGFVTLLVGLLAVMGVIISKTDLFRPPKATGVAVLPFQNLSHDPNDTYFTDGVQDEILTRLAKVADLKVISHTSTQRFTSAPADVREIARKLGVTHVVEGSVQKANDHVRVNVQLINALTDSHLWAETYDRKLIDIFAVESEIAKTIADSLQVKLSGSEKTAMSNKPTQNPEAYQLYLKGRFFWNKRTAADMLKAADYYNQAIGKDPNYALAYAGLAEAYVVFQDYGVSPPAESIPRAKAAATKALSLNDALAEPHAALGLAYAYYDCDATKSIAEFERAIQLNPNYATAHQWYSMPWQMVGQFDRAIAEGKRAIELDPLSLIAHTDLAFTYLTARRFDEAVAQSRKALEIDPDFHVARGYLAEALQFKGQLSEAIAEYRRANESIDEPDWLAQLAQALARAGQRDEAQKIFAHLVEKRRTQFVSGYSVALVHLSLGDKTHAIDELETGVGQHVSEIPLIKYDPRLDELRGEPRFEALVEKVLASKSEPTSVSPPPAGVAVLPFVNMSSDQENDYLSDGITEDLCTVLSQIKGLRVPARTSSFAFKGKTEDIRNIGKQLSVSTVLEGSVTKSGNKLRISAQLNNVADGYHLWAATYDREITDILEIRSDISRRVADALKIQLGVEEKQRLEKKPTENPEAHELYLKGRFFWNKRTGADLKKAIQYFEQAIGKDPNDALAYAGLADAYVLSTEYTVAAPSESLPRAETAARKAVELDDSLAEAHTSLGQVLWEYYLDATGATKEFERAIALNPNYATAHHWYGVGPPHILGDFEKSITELKRALELDPLSLIINADFGSSFITMRRYDEAIAQLRKTLEMDPHFYFAHWNLGEALQFKGQLNEAIAEYKKAAELNDDPYVIGELAQAYARAGQRDETLKLLAQLQQIATRRWVPSYAFAIVHTALGEKDRAIDDLERAYRERDLADLSYIKIDAELDDLRGEPRFEALVQKVFPSKAEPTPVAPPAGIAVLPFVNLSSDKKDEYLSDGIQDEILTRLSKITGLKVISRTSTQHYKSAPENLPEIARQLGVAHILEGSVQKSGNAVRVNVQLIKAATDSHVWADSFDRKLTDVFSVETEVARAIADQLSVKLTGQEQQVIAAKPTDNVEAYDAYLRGLAYTLKSGNTQANTIGAQKYLREAVRLDPKFAPAWALLSFVDARGYLTTIVERTAALREEARQAAETALTLQPNLGEAVMAKGYYHYACLKDYEAAVHYFEQAREPLPNSSRIPQSLATVARRQGQWDRSESYFIEAERLDPLNVSTLSQHAFSYMCLRRFPEALRKFDQVLNITPDDIDILARQAGIAQAEGDLARAAALLSRLHPPADYTNALETQVYQAILERHPATIISQLKEILANPDPVLGYINGELRFWLGWAQEVAGDNAAAQETWRQARSELEPLLREQPENYRLLGDLALTNMGLGDKATALTMAQRAMTVNPIEKDVLTGPTSIDISARVAARMGEPGRAIDLLEKLLSMPYADALSSGVPLTPALLRLDPMFDPLRSDPRFQKLVASPMPNETGVAAGIAVLPFTNLSSDKENAYFVDGIQDEILTRLSKIADLKVISRTSTQHYKSAPENLPEIARQLGVAHILEGSVQKSGDSVRVNVQLIKASNDSHVWADTFDRKMTDIFFVETEVAKTIADQLRAKLTGREEQVIAAKPTNNPVAYDAYLRGLAYNLKTINTPGSALGAQKYLREAVRLDPSFALAWALLSWVDSSGYSTLTLQATAALREEARQAAETALSLQPNLAEAVVAEGYYRYVFLKDYDTAVRYFEQARQLLPNNSRIPEVLAYVARRRGQWDQSESYFNEAERLDPRNVSLLTQHAISYKALRHFTEAVRKFEQVLNVTPDDLDTLAQKAGIAQAEGDLSRASALLAPLHPNADDNQALETQVYQSILERRPEVVIHRLKEILARPDPALGFHDGELRFWLGWAQEVAGDHVAAQETWRQARSELEFFLKEQPKNYFLIGHLALTSMGLGDKAAAFKLIEQAMAAVPIEKDAIFGPISVEILARVAARTGEPDRAIAALQKLLSTPAISALASGVSLTPALLRLDPMFDPLRSDLRFQKLCEEKRK